MGYEIPAGIGVKMAAPEREVFVFIGDGSYLMLNTEIVTAVQEGVKIIIVLVDNGGFQSIHGLQMGSGSPSFGNELRFRDDDAKALAGPHVEVDFLANAESLGARGLRATNVEELRAALDEAKAETRPTMIYVRVDENARVPNFEGWWDVPIAEVSGEESVRAAREQYEREIEAQKLFF
jgi:3D-(3,5/4)-trihydroxycyclohexane-1,2-dione acylhydrolase (decyclizing)